MTHISLGQLSLPSQTWRKSACSKHGKDYSNSDLSTPILKFLIQWLHEWSFFPSRFKPHVPYVPFSVSQNTEETKLFLNPVALFFSHSSGFFLSNLALSTKLLEKMAISDSCYTATENRSPPTLQTCVAARHNLVLLKILRTHLFAYPFFNWLYYKFLRSQMTQPEPSLSSVINGFIPPLWNANGAHYVLPRASRQHKDGHLMSIYDIDMTKKSDLADLNKV